ncbi:YbjN domain-containing protein [Neolewinella persica]|uniref:YbjN domain-containing protein n=1 Tax=Neolewinella persica TaxID=70998 RepID=UPI0006950703|nr:YbjN domain-containing protein [Neolewinella persica]
MKFSRLILMTLVLATGFTLPLAAQSESDLQELFIGILAQIKVEGKVDGDGDIEFEYQDRSYFLEVNENDTEFYRLVMPNIWPIESELERLKVLKAVNEVNKTKKVAKAYAVNDNVWLTVEMFIDKPDNFIGSLDRQFKVINEAVETFVEAMK